MSDALKPDGAPQGPAHRKPRLRSRKGPPKKPPVDAYRAVSLWCGRTRSFDTEEGGRLRVDPGAVSLSFRLRRNADPREGEPIDTASCLLRLVDDAGAVWEAESTFSLNVFIEKMVNLDRSTWLVFLDEVEARRCRTGRSAACDRREEGA